MDAELQNEQTQLLQLKLVSGTLAADYKQRTASNFRSGDALPVGGGGVGKKRRSMQKNVFHTSIDSSSQLPLFGDESNDNAPASLMPPHLRMTTFIYNEKDVYKNDVESYRLFNERVKRGIQLRDEASAEGKRTIELTEIAVKSRSRVLEQLAKVERLTESLGGLSSEALMSLGNGNRAAMNGEVPQELDLYVARAKARRAAPSRTKSQLKSNLDVVLTLKGLQPRSHSNLSQARSPTKSDKTSLGRDDTVVSEDVQTELIDAETFSLNQPSVLWFENMVALSGGSDGQPISDVTLLDETASDAQLHQHIENLALSAGLVVPRHIELGHATEAGAISASLAMAVAPPSVPESLKPSSSNKRAPPHTQNSSPSSPVEGDDFDSSSPDTTGSMELDNGEATTCSSPKQQQQETVAAGGEKRAASAVSLVTFSTLPIVPSVAAEIVTEPSQGHTVASSMARRVSFAEKKSNNISSGPSEAAGSITDIPVPTSSVHAVATLESSSIHYPPSLARSSSVFMSTSTTGAFSPNVEWSKGGCGCESVFHSIKQKMFEDVKRALRVRYVSTYLSQMTRFAQDVVEWKDNVSVEVNRMLDVIALLIQENEKAKEDVRRVESVLEELQAVVATAAEAATADTAGVSPSHHSSGTFLKATGADASRIQLRSPRDSSSANEAKSPGASPRKLALPSSISPRRGESGQEASLGLSPRGNLFSNVSFSNKEPFLTSLPQQRNRQNSAVAPSALQVTAGVIERLQKMVTQKHSTPSSWRPPQHALLERLAKVNQHAELALMELHDVNASNNTNSRSKRILSLPPDALEAKRRSTLAASSPKATNAPAFVTPLPTKALPSPPTAVVAPLNEDFLLAASQQGSLMGSPWIRQRSPSIDEASDVSYATTADAYHHDAAAPPPGGRGDLALSSTVMFRMVSTRVTTTGTQTLSEEDYFLENMDRVMVGGSKHESHMADIAASVRFGSPSAMFSPLTLLKPLSPQEEAATDGAVERKHGERTAALRQILGSFVVPLENILSPLPAPSFAQDLSGQLNEINSAVKMFSEDVIAARFKRVKPSLRHVDVLDLNDQCEVFDDSLQLKLQQLSSRLLAVYRAFGDQLTVIRQHMGSSSLKMDEATKLQSRTQELEEKLAAASAKCQELTSANVALESKLSKATVAATAAAKKAEVKTPAVQKDQVARLQRSVDDWKRRLVSLTLNVKQTVLQWSRNGDGNEKLLAWLGQQFGKDPDEADPTDVTQAVTAAMDTLRSIAESGFLSTLEFPDKALLQLNHDVSRCASTTASILRMNKIDVPLEILDSVERAIKAFSAEQEGESQEDYLRRAQRAANSGLPPPVPGYMSLTGVAPYDLCSSVTLQVQHITNMMQVCRKELPGQRRLLIQPFLSAIRTLAADTKQDISLNTATIEWYLKTKEKHKELLAGEENANPEFLNMEEEKQEEGGGGGGEDAMGEPSTQNPNTDETRAVTTADGSMLASIASSSSIARSTSNFSPRSKKRVPASPKQQEDDDDNPLHSMNRAMQLYRREIDDLLDLISEKKSAIQSEQTLGNKIQSFVQQQHTPFSTRIRRNAKDVVAKLLAIVEGKNIATAIHRDACEGTATSEVSEAFVQATPEIVFVDGSTDYATEDFEPYEGDEAVIQGYFNEYTSLVEPFNDPMLDATGTMADDDVDVVAPITDVAVIVPVVVDPSSKDEGPPIQHCEYNSSNDLVNNSITAVPLDEGSRMSTPGVPRFTPVVNHTLRRCSSEAGNRPPVKVAAARSMAVGQNQQRQPPPPRVSASIGVQTNVDSGAMNALYSRIPLPQVFLLSTVVGQSLDTLDKMCPVNMQVEEWQKQWQQLDRLIHYRRAQERTELGQDMLVLMEAVQRKMQGECEERLRLTKMLGGASSSKPPVAPVSKSAAAVAKRDTATTVEVRTSHASVQVEGKTGVAGFADDLVDEETALHSFVSFLDSLKKHAEWMKALKEADRVHRAASTRRDSTPPNTSLVPAMRPEVLEILAVDESAALTGSPPSSMQPLPVSRRGTSRGGDVLSTSFTGLPPLLPPSRSSLKQGPILPPMMGLGGETIDTPGGSEANLTARTDVASPTAVVKAAGVVNIPAKTVELLQLEKNVLIPLRRGLFRMINEPPFALPPEKHAKHPKQNFSVASLRREIRAVGLIHTCLQRSYELGSSYRRTLIRLVGVHIALQQWERIKSRVLDDGKEILVEHSRKYAFLTAKPATMNMRAKRERQAQQLEERTTAFEKRIAHRSEALQHEVERLERIRTNLKQQQQEQMLVFLKDYYFVESSSSSGKDERGGGAKEGKGIPSPHPIKLDGSGSYAAVSPSAALSLAQRCQQSIATVLPLSTWSTVLQEQSCIGSLSTLLSMMWGGGPWSLHGGGGGAEDDPKARSWFDRTGTSQGGNRPPGAGLRFEDSAAQLLLTHRTDEDPPVVPLPNQKDLVRQHVEVSVEDLLRLRRDEILSQGWSTGTIGNRTNVLHAIYNSKKRGFVVPGLEGTAMSPSIATGAAPLRPLSELDDEFCGGVPITGWKGGLVHLDLQSDDAQQLQSHPNPPAAGREAAASGMAEDAPPRATSPWLKTMRNVVANAKHSLRRENPVEGHEGSGVLKSPVTWLGPIRSRSEGPPPTCSSAQLIAKSVEFALHDASEQKPQRMSPPPAFAHASSTLAGSGVISRRKLGAGVMLAPLRQ